MCTPVVQFKFPKPVYLCAWLKIQTSPNQVLTHAARAAAKQLNKPPLVAARGAREGLWLEQIQTAASPGPRARAARPGPNAIAIALKISNNAFQISY